MERFFSPSFPAVFFCQTSGLIAKGLEIEVESDVPETEVAECGWVDNPCVSDADRLAGLQHIHVEGIRVLSLQSAVWPALRVSRLIDAKRPYSLSEVVSWWSIRARCQFRLSSTFFRLARKLFAPDIVPGWFGSGT